MRHHGKIAQWFEEEGYGYIHRDDEAEPVPLYMDAIYHGQSKPKLGDEVTFDLVETDQGWQARDLVYVQKPQPMIKPTRFVKPSKRKNRTALIIMILFGFLVLKLLVPQQAMQLVENGQVSEENTNAEK